MTEACAAYSRVSTAPCKAYIADAIWGQAGTETKAQDRNFSDIVT